MICWLRPYPAYAGEIFIGPEFFVAIWKNSGIKNHKPVQYKENLNFQFDRTMDLLLGGFFMGRIPAPGESGTRDVLQSTTGVEWKC